MADVKKIATRASYGNAVAALGAENDKIVVLDADLAGATNTGTFKKAFPDFYIVITFFNYEACGIYTKSTHRRMFC